MSDEEIDEVVTFETIEEAIPRLREQLPPGSSILLHAEDCAIDEDADCDCTPILIERKTEQA